MKTLERAFPMPFDPFDQAFLADPYPVYRRLHQHGPVGRSESGIVYILGHPECAAVLRDSGCLTGGVRAYTYDLRRLLEHTPALSLLFMNPPRHTELRRNVATAFTPRAVARLEDRIAHHVTRLLEPLEGQVDLLESFGYPLPLAVIGELLDLPDTDNPLHRKWTDALARGLDLDLYLTETQRDDRDAARREAFAYFTDLARHRRQHPGDDLISDLARRDDLTETELAGVCTLMLTAGHETVANLIGNGVLALLKNPGEFAELRQDPDMTDSAITELLRFDAPVQLTVRLPGKDIEVAGERVYRNEPAVLLLAAANHDPRVFKDPHRLNLRRPGNAHLSFSLGAHFCVGAMLAKLEGRIAFRALLKRRIDLCGPVAYKENFTVRGLTGLPVELGAASGA